MRADASPRHVLIPILAVALVIPALNYALLRAQGAPADTQMWELGIRLALAPLLWLGYRVARWLLGAQLLLAALGIAANLALSAGSPRRATILATEIALNLAVAGLLFFSRAAREHFAPRAGGGGERATA